MTISLIHNKQMEEKTTDNLNGPLLPKNPEVCDDLLARALKRKCGEDVRLPQLDDAAEKKANGIIAARYTGKNA